MNTKPFNPATIAAQVKTKSKGLPPVHLWDPPFCGDIDMRIASDGRWYYLDSAIERKAMVRLFSTVLRYDKDGSYYLVTPVEKVRIQVDDCPFVVVAMDVTFENQQQVLNFTDNVGNQVVLNEGHPIQVTHNTKGQPHPTILIRGNLMALIHRNVYYQLVDLALRECCDDADAASDDKNTKQIGVWSCGEFFNLG